MFGSGSWHLLILSFQAVLMAVFLTFLFRLRTRFGLGFFIAAAVALNLVDGNVRLQELAPAHAHWLVHFGGSLLFSAKLFAVLLLYVREDALEARGLLYGLFFGAICLLALSASSGLHFSSQIMESGAYVTALKNSAIHAFGMAILIVDAIVLILVYEWASQRFARYGTSHFFPALIALLASLSLDNAIYYLIFVGSAEFTQALWLSFLGKWYAALIYASAFALSQRWIGVSADEQGSRRLGDVYESLSFRQRFEALRQSAEIDVLTGLYTRARLETDASARLAQDGQSLWVLDIDHFKRVNDQHGHLRGDAVLREVANRIRENLPSDASAYRYGGEEFVVLGNVNRDDAERVRLAICANPIDELAISLSIGLATSAEAQKLRAAFSIADQRLYRAKSNGRNQVVAEG
jgi:diguanylate cyclase (GGDEF)-like protein